MSGVKCEIYHDNFQNYKKYGIPKAQKTIIAGALPFSFGSFFRSLLQK